MSKPKQKSVTPKLRFPEFRDAGPWEVKRLGEIGKIIKGKGISKSDISEDGALPCIRYGELYTHYSEIIQEIASLTDVNPDNLVLSEENDVIIPASGETKEDIATASCLTEKGVALGSDLNIFRSPLNGAFLVYYVRGNLKAEISKVAQGDSVVHLYPAQLEKMKLAIPPKCNEQQKIADCLSSLDDLIRAEEAQLAALKDHKKGLMQQLFPAPGETTPRLRFPEFRDAGPWEVKRLGELSVRIVERVGNKSLIPVSISAGRGFVSQVEKFGRNISGKQYKNYIHIKRGQFSYNKGNSKLFPQGAIHQLIEFEQAAVPSAFYCFEFNNGCVPGFYKGYFELNFHGFQLDKFITSGARSDGLLNISANDFFSITFPTPKKKEEQQKIADCLSSLDGLIRAKATRIEALKAHKRGLMQQLFPQEEG